MTSRPDDTASSATLVGHASGPSRLRTWLTGSRPRTLTMAVAPVVVGASLAVMEGVAIGWGVLALTASCAVLIQAGTNLLNDVADFESGNDRPDRVGPVRITAAGWATPRDVRRAAIAAFGLALALGAVLVAVGGPAILALGLLSIVGGWAYSGGSRPVSHGAFGEIFVLLFFGVVAVAGTFYLQAGRWSITTVLAGLAMGSMAAAVLLLNNYRDLAADARAGRRTLAAVLGPARTRALYACFLLLPLAVPAWLALRGPAHPTALLAWLCAPLLVDLVVKMRRLQGPALNAVLGRTAMAQLVFGFLFALGVAL
jgi:1,4-dihydroxy-2-naphthoate octaprenyltransferase